uniref:Uncharacterized protein n=1 Tax=Onchocerca volvulus TaxID=6282 RepID=A0A8R1TR60_ONCVO
MQVVIIIIDIIIHRDGYQLGGQQLLDVLSNDHPEYVHTQSLYYKEKSMMNTSANKCWKQYREFEIETKEEAVRWELSDHPHFLAKPSVASRTDKHWVIAVPLLSPTPPALSPSSLSLSPSLFFPISVALSVL